MTQRILTSLGSASKFSKKIFIIIEYYVKVCNQVAGLISTAKGLAYTALNHGANVAEVASRYALCPI